MALLARVKSKSFLRSSCHGLSEYMVGSSGIQFFTRLDSGEQCGIIQYTLLGIWKIEYALAFSYITLLVQNVNKIKSGAFGLGFYEILSITSH